MSLREYVTIVFSKDLAKQTPDNQKEAVIKLREYIRKHAGIWEFDDEFSIDYTFEPFLTGGLELNAIWKKGVSVPFQEEVIGGRLTAEEKRELRTLGFESLGHNPPIYVQ